MKRLLSGAMVGAMLLASAPSALAAESIDYNVTSTSLIARGAAISVSLSPGRS